MTAEAKKTTAKKTPKSVDRPALKKKLKALKKVREEVKTAKDIVKLERVRRQYRRVTHALRSSAVAKPKAVKAD